LQQNKTSCNIALSFNLYGQPTAIRLIQNAEGLARSFVWNLKMASFSV